MIRSRLAGVHEIRHHGKRTSSALATISPSLQSEKSSSSGCTAVALLRAQRKKTRNRKNFRISRPPRGGLLRARKHKRAAPEGYTEVLFVRTEFEVVISRRG